MPLMKTVKGERLFQHRGGLIGNTVSSPRRSLRYSLPLQNSQIVFCLHSPHKFFFFKCYNILSLHNESNVCPHLVILNFSDNLKDLVFLWELRRFAYFLRWMKHLKAHWIIWNLNINLFSINPWGVFVIIITAIKETDDGSFFLFLFFKLVSTDLVCCGLKMWKSPLEINFTHIHYLNEWVSLSFWIHVCDNVRWLTEFIWTCI